MDRIIDAIIKAARECGTLLTECGLYEFAFSYGYYTVVEILDDDGNLLDTEKRFTRQDLQELADIFTDGLDVINF